MGTTDTDTAPPLNSRSWWEGYFDAQWDANDGRAQTTYFMKCLVDNLPYPERKFLSSRTVTILDWGCAFGNGVDVLAKTFPQCRVAGMDFAERAIVEARNSFPDYDFRHTKNGEIDDQFDVIITSNCLEHFTDPVSTMRQHLRCCRRLYVALVPYREAPLHPQHATQFCEESFPKKLEGFTRLATVVVDCQPAYWPGKQILVIYGTQAYRPMRALRNVIGQLISQSRRVARVCRPAMRGDFGPIVSAVSRRVTKSKPRLDGGLRRRTPSSNRLATPAPQPTIKDVIARVHSSKGAVIFLPSIPWSTVLFQRPHHLARLFAREGYLVIYDCNYPGPGRDDVQGFREIEPNLFLFRGPQHLLRKLPRATLWSFTYNYQQTNWYPANYATVYDWIDALELFYHHGSQSVHRNHELALREAAVIATVTRTLQAEAIQTRSDTLYLPNAVDYDHFAADTEVPDDPAILHLRQQGKPIAGYYGAMASWFDYELLTATARRRPDWNFLLIGPQYDQNPDAKPPIGVPNITWIGPRDYQALPGYLKLFDVAMIPFQVNEITKATSPLKLYEFFAGGKPVISSPMPECQAYPEVHTVTSVEQFSTALDAALKESRDAAYCKHLRGIGRLNSWACRVQTVAQALDQRRAMRDNWQAKVAQTAIGLRRRCWRIRRGIANTWLFSAVWGRVKLAAIKAFPADTPRGQRIRLAMGRTSQGE